MKAKKGHEGDFEPIESKGKDVAVIRRRRREVQMNTELQSPSGHGGKVGGPNRVRGGGSCHTKGGGNFNSNGKGGRPRKELNSQLYSHRRTKK